MWNPNKGGNEWIDYLKNFGNLKNINFSFLDFIYIVNKGKLKKKKFFIKKVEDANSITKDTYEKLILLSSIYDFYPLIISNKYNVKNRLKEGVIHYYKNIPLLKEESFIELLEEGKLYFEQKNYLKLIVKDKSINESEFLKMSDKELSIIEKEGGKNPFNNEMKMLLNEKAKKIKKKKLVGKKALKFDKELIKELENFIEDIDKIFWKDSLLEFKTPFNYIEEKEGVLFKEVYKFDKNNEKKILEFSKLTNKTTIFLSKIHKKVKVIDDNIFIVPKK